MIDLELQEQLRKQYNPDGSLLRKGQLRMLDILRCVDGICQKHSIPYWLSSGTLLGAVRHGGFIPWDDDLDIEMLREDYLKLLPILREELPDEFLLQDKEVEKYYPYLFVKVRDKNSLIKEPVNYSFKNEGLFIDIFALEKSFYPLFKISLLLYNKFCFGLYKCKHLFKINRNFLEYLIFPLFRIISKLNRTDILRHTYGMGFMKERSRKDIFPLKKIKFEGYYFNAPHDYDAYLTKMFGDYMKLPSQMQYHGTIEYIKYNN